MMETFEIFAQNEHTVAAPGYGLMVLATNWGFSGNWDAFAAKAAAEGYDGVEVWAPQDPEDRKNFLAAMKTHGLKFGLLIGGGDRDPARHLEQFNKALEIALSMNPVYINCHSGKDWFNFESNLRIIEASYRMSAGSGIPVCHETHRGRMLYSATVTREFLQRAPELKITADLSHWCTVHESLLEDQQESLALALSRAEHIHARIGHPEGPQVNDPRAPEWEKAVTAHLSWWDTVAARKKKEGKLLTILTEFGPADYMPTTPFTRQPLADQWGINVYMKDLLRKRYS
jgi:sugar phosphate isomerase/epimerase